MTPSWKDRTRTCNAWVTARSDAISPPTNARRSDSRCRKPQPMNHDRAAIPRPSTIREPLYVYHRSGRSGIRTHDPPEGIPA